MAEILDVDLVVLPPHSVFVGHGYLQHKVAEYVSSHNMRYHINIYPDNSNIQDRIVFVFGWCLDVAKQKKGNLYVADANVR